MANIIILNYNNLNYLYTMDLEKMSEQGLDLIMNYGPKLLMAVAFGSLDPGLLKSCLKVQIKSCKKASMKIP